MSVGSLYKLGFEDAGHFIDPTTKQTITKTAGWLQMKLKVFI